MNEVKHFLQRFSTLQLFGFAVFLVLVISLPLLVMVSQQQQNTQQYAYNETWIITARPVCDNGQTPTEKGHLFWKVGLTSAWQTDDFAVGTHQRSINNSTTGPLYVGMETESEYSLEPLEPKPYSTVEYGKFFNPPTWMMKALENTFPSGQYTINFRAPAAWCNATPTATPTYPPATLPQELTVRPLVACLNNAVSDSTPLIKFIYSEERYPYGQPNSIQIATRDPGEVGSWARDFEYRRNVYNSYCSASCTLSSDEALHGNRCCIAQPNQFQKSVGVAGTDPNDTLTISPGTTYHTRLVIAVGTAGQATDVRATFTIPTCASLTPTPTLTPTVTPTPRPTSSPTPPPTASLTPTPTRIPTPTPSPTPNPQAANFRASLALSGVGQGANASPRNTTRQARLEVYSSNGQLVTLKTSSIEFEPSDGAFKGTITTTNSIPSGQYRIKIKTDRYLRKLIPGIITINQTQSTPYILPKVTLVTGDVDENNMLDVRDLNIMRDCGYASLPPLLMTDPNSKYSSTECLIHPTRANADLNDDGVINLTDYNLFVQSLVVQTGD